MKRIMKGLLVVAIGVILASVAMAYTGTYTPGAGINGTPHDINRNDTGMAYMSNPPDTDPATGIVMDRICIYCHVAHNSYRLSPANGGPGAGVGSGPQAPDAYDYLPLWNHEPTLRYPFYTMYQNGPGAPQTGAHASQAILNGMTPGSSSLLCLSCHDGSVAVNSYGNTDQPPPAPSGGGLTIANAYAVGRDDYLGNHHPIGFSYFDAWAIDDELRDPDATMFTTVSTITDHLYGANGTLECGSCHSVHNKGNGGERLLWRSDVHSELCLTCHDKGDYVPPTFP